MKFFTFFLNKRFDSQLLILHSVQRGMIPPLIIYPPLFWVPPPFVNTPIPQFYRLFRYFCLTPPPPTKNHYLLDEYLFTSSEI